MARRFQSAMGLDLVAKSDLSTGKFFFLFGLRSLSSLLFLFSLLLRKQEIHQLCHEVERVDHSIHRSLQSQN